MKNSDQLMSKLYLQALALSTTESGGSVGGAGALFCSVFSAPALGKAGLAQSSSSQYL